MIEATEAVYAAEDMDACVFECVLPFDGAENENTFNLPTTNEVHFPSEAEMNKSNQNVYWSQVLLLTRWGSVVYAPVAPETVYSQRYLTSNNKQYHSNSSHASWQAPQTQIMADGEFHADRGQQEETYDGRDTFTIISREASLI